MDAKSHVRKELESFGESQILALGEGTKPFVREYFMRRRGRGRVDDAFCFDLADRIADYARSHPNVIRVDGLRKPTASLTRKGRADVHVVAVEPTSQGTYVLSRIHYAIDRAAMTWCWDDGRVNFVPHVAERLLERGDPSGEGVRRAARALYQSCGMLALGARLWSSLDRGDGTWHRAALPLPDGGLAMGSLIPLGATSNAAKPGAGRVTADRIRETDVAAPGLAIHPRFVHAPPEERYVVGFTAMTYIGASDMSRRKERVRDMLAGIRDAHPVVALAGMSWLWPASRQVQEALAERRGELARAYDALAALHDDRDMAAVFGRKPWRRAPPLPWEEKPGDVREHLTGEISRWATPRERDDAMRAAVAAWRAKNEIEEGGAPTP